MKKSVIVVSILCSLFIAVIFNQIKNVTGVEVDALLYIAMAIMVLGLYRGFYANNKDCAKKGL